MTKVNTKKTGKKHGSKESSFNIMPFMMLILFLFVWFGFKFITESSTINLNRRNFTQKLKY